MSAITKAVPKALLTGIRDASRRALVIDPEQLPQHLPLLYLLTERGPTTPQLSIGDSFARMFGSESLNVRSKFYNHQSALAAIIMGNANQVFIQRVKPANAATAFLRLSVEIIRTELQTYQRVSGTGEFALDSNGAKIPNGVIEGYNVKWRRNWKPSGGTAFGGGDVQQITNPTTGMTTYTDVNSVIYPIIDLEVSSFGGYGNNVGLRISAPTVDTANIGDTATMAARKAFLYRFTCLEKPAGQTTAQIIETNGGDLSVDLTFKENITHPISGQALSFSETFVDQWQDVNTQGVPPKYGPFGNAFFYTDNLETVLALLTRGETNSEHQDRTGSTGTVADTTGESQWDASAVAFGRTASFAFANTANMHLMNPFTGEDLNGVPFQAVNVDQSVAFGGTAFNETIIHYANGGSDGLSNDDDQAGKLKNLLTYDKLVAAAVGSFGDQTDYPLLDEAKYPISAIWDSGFSLNTKKKLLTPMARRKDIYVVLSPQSIAEYADVSDPQDDEFAYRTALNTVSFENSIAVALRTEASLYPESFIDGTATCRAVIIGHGGKLINSEYRGFLPLTLDFADKVSKYMGASNGRWESTQSFDESPLNQVRIFKDVNNAWKSESNYIKDWDAGLVWVQNYDRQSLFYPAVQTVYPDDTSVLNSFMVMAACVELEHVCQRSWRDLTGGTKLTRAQFIDRSNKLIEDRTKDRFDGRFVIVPETFFTEADDARGYSWGTRVHIYANNMRTVGTYTVVAHRMEDLVLA